MFEGFRSMLLALAVSLTACAPAPAQHDVTSAVGEEDALELATSALSGLNEGGYDAWTARWSDELRSMIDEPTFLSVREQVLAASGRWESIDDQALVAADTEGYVRWTFDTTFELEPVTVWFAFAEDDVEVVGVMLESENLSGN